MIFRAAADIDPWAITGAVGSAASAVAAVATTDWAVVIIGVPLSTILAAFAGALISLTFMQAQGLARSGMVLLAGTAVGSWLAPLVEHTFSIPVVLEKGVAFGLGLAVQVAVPAFLEWVKRRGQQ